MSPPTGSLWLQEIVYLLRNPSERKREVPKDEDGPSILEGGKDTMEDIFPYLVSTDQLVHIRIQHILYFAFLPIGVLLPRTEGARSTRRGPPHEDTSATQPST